MNFGRNFDGYKSAILLEAPTQPIESLPTGSMTTGIKAVFT